MVNDFNKWIFGKSKYVARVLLKTQGQCWYCGTLLNEQTFSIDHQIPRSKGGSNDPENIVPACKGCNFDKGSLTVDQFRNMIAREICFTEEQVAWLREHGFNGKIPVYQFYGERIKSHDSKFLEENT